MSNAPDTDIGWRETRGFFVDYRGDTVSYFKGKVSDIYSQ
jgi:hypothetical protein